LRAEHGVHFIHLTDQLGPALRGDGPELFLNDPETEGRKARLLDFPPIGVGVEKIKTRLDPNANTDYYLGIKTKPK